MSPDLDPPVEPCPAGADDLRATSQRAIERAVDERWASRLAARDTSLWTDGPGGRRDHRQPPWLAGRARGVHGRDRRAGRLRRGHPEVRLHGRHRVRHGRQLAGAGGARGGAAPVVDRADASGCSIPRTRRPSRAVEAASDPETTLRIIATKSGTTTETLAFLAHFWESEQHRVGRFHGNQVGDGFVAVTDPGGSLEAIPHSDLFRETFLNPADVGGRYSALTYVGLVPAALHGLDVGALLDDARGMLAQCLVDDATNPGVSLGAAIGALAQAGRDKLTFVIEPDLAPLGAWLEQLIAESTGKSGTGVVPVDGEPLGAPDVYGADRVFVRLGRPSRRPRSPTRRSPRSPPPAIRSSTSRSPTAPGSLREFMRWEVATAIAGAVLGVDPFDEPNVTESKQNTRVALEAHAQNGAFPDEAATVTGGALRLFGDAGARRRASARRTSTAADVLRAHLARAADAGYHAICAYVAATPERTAALRAHPGAAARSHPPGHDARLRATLPALDRTAAQGRHTVRLLPAARRGPPGRPAHPGPEGDLRRAHRRAGAGRLGSRSRRMACRCSAIHLSDAPDTGLAELDDAARAGARLTADGDRTPTSSRQEPTTMDLVIVGLGRMGANMCRRLHLAGHRVVAFNRSPEKTREIVAEGIEGAFSPEEAVGDAVQPAHRVAHGARR